MSANQIETKDQVRKPNRIHAVTILRKKESTKFALGQSTPTFERKTLTYVMYNFLSWQDRVILFSKQNSSLFEFETDFVSM